MDRDRILHQLRAFFATESRAVAAAWLFGSVARDRARADSDVDVGILLAEDPSEQRTEATVDWWQKLGRAITDREVDVVIMNGAPPDLVHRVLRDGVLVFEGDRSRRIGFEVTSRNEYFDMVPVLQEYRRFSGGEP